MDSNKDVILEELTNFQKNINNVEEIPDILENYLNNVAKSGDIGFSWEEFKPLIKKKIEIISNEFNETYPCDPNSNQPNIKKFDFEDVKKNILNGIDSFTGAPFTIQRLCELLTCPYKHYKRTDKFMRGLEKNVMVISTVDHKAENGDLNSTFIVQPSTSSSINNQQPCINGYKENQSNELYSNNVKNNLSSSCSTQPAPIQQLDSFTTVFVSPPTTPLDVIANMPIFDNENSTEQSACTNESQKLSSIIDSISDASNNILDDNIKKDLIEYCQLMKNVNTDKFVENNLDASDVNPTNTDKKETNEAEKTHELEKLEEESDKENNESTSTISSEEDIENKCKDKFSDLKRECESPELTTKRFKSNDEITDEDNTQVKEIIEPKLDIINESEEIQDNVNNEKTNLEIPILNETTDDKQNEEVLEEKNLVSETEPTEVRQEEVEEKKDIQST